VEQVPYIQWAHNSSYHSSLGMSPYNVLYGRECHHPVSQEHHGELSRLNYSEEYPGAVHNSLVMLEQAIREQRQAAQDRQKGQFDKNTFLTELTAGDKVYITAMSDPKRPKKFQLKFQGPYTLIKEMGAYNYLLLDQKGKSIIVHHDRIKKIRSRAPLHRQVDSSHADHDEGIKDGDESLRMNWEEELIEDEVVGRNHPARESTPDSDQEEILSLADTDTDSLMGDFDMNELAQWQEDLREDAQEIARRQMYQDAASHRPVTRSQTVGVVHMANCPWGRKSKGLDNDMTRARQTTKKGKEGGR